MRSVIHWILAAAYAAILLAAPPAAAQNVCPPPPNPNAGNCPLAINNTDLREADLNLDGEPDNRGSTGSFCGGNSGADCIGELAAEVGFNLIITNLATQTVTCTAPGANVWIMTNGCVSCLASGFGSATLPAGMTTDPSLEIVIADVNADVCPCGPTVTCTFSTEAACSDGADGDGDGLIDDADPDCCVDSDNDGFCGAADCDDGDPLVHMPPSVVCDVLLSVDSFGNTTVNWVEQSGAVVDGLSGLISELDEDLSLATCQFNNRPGSVYIDPRPDPPEGDGYFFLMRAQNACGATTYGRGAALDAAAPCPEPAPGCSIVASAVRSRIMVPAHNRHTRRTP